MPSTKFDKLLDEHRMPHEPVEQDPVAAPDYEVTYFNNPFPGAVDPADKAAAPTDNPFHGAYDPTAGSEETRVTDDGELEHRHDGGDWHSHDDDEDKPKPKPRRRSRKPKTDGEDKPKPKPRRRSRKPKTDGEAYIESGDPAPFEVDTNAAIRDSVDE